MTTDINATIRKLSRMRANAFHLGGHPPTDAEYEAQVAKLEREIADDIRALAASAGDAAPGVPACLNAWFCSLPEGRQAVLREDKWSLAHAAFDAGRASATPSAPAAPQVAAAPADEEKAASYAAVAALANRRDGYTADYAPYWHGWALRETFLAGAKWQAGRAAAPEVAPQVAAAPANEREAFEAWFTANDPDPAIARRAVERGPGGTYRLMSAATAWAVWQARAALAAAPEVAAPSEIVAFVPEHRFRRESGGWSEWRLEWTRVWLVYPYKSAEDSLRALRQHLATMLSEEDEIRIAVLRMDADRAAQAACTGGAKP